MAKIAIVHDRAGIELAAKIAEHARNSGHEATLSPRDRFPIADPMATFLASLPTAIVIISPTEQASQWLLREISANRSLYPHLGLIVSSEVEGSDHALDPSVAVAEHSLTPQTVDILISSLGGGAV